MPGDLGEGGWTKRKLILNLTQDEVRVELGKSKLFMIEQTDY